MQKKRAAIGDFRQPVLQIAGLASNDQRRKGAQRGFGVMQFRFIGIVGNLPNWLASPAIDAPICAHDTYPRVIDFQRKPAIRLPGVVFHCYLRLLRYPHSRYDKK